MPPLSVSSHNILYELPANIINVLLMVKSYKVKQSLDRPLGFQEVEGPRISRQSALEGGKVVSPMHRPPLPPKEIFLVLISVRG
jgi:hypothetical protein